MKFVIINDSRKLINTAILLFLFSFLLPDIGSAVEVKVYSREQARKRINVTDPPDGDGRTLVVTWGGFIDPFLTRYDIYRRKAGTKDWNLRGSVQHPDTLFVDRHNPEADLILEPGTEYQYMIQTEAPGRTFWSPPSEPIAAIPKWFDVKRSNMAIVILAYFGSVLFYIRRTGKGKSQFIRKIAGMAAMDEALGRATEMGRPVLYIPGIMDIDNIQTIASMAILSDVAHKTATYDVPLIVPLNRAFVVPLAEESVREGYVRAGRPDSFIADNVRYLSDEQFAFTAGVTGIMNREKTAAHFFLGAFFAESLIVSEVGYSTGAIQIAGTANIHQLPFFVVACDYTLIGEEFYAASAYISREPKLLGTLKGADFVKVGLMAAILLGSLLTWAGVDVIARVFGV